MLKTRTHEVDVIRLVALLGICIANLPSMAKNFSDPLNFYDGISLNQYTALFSGLLVEGKFILLFTFILGWGLATQEQRYNSDNRSFKNYYFRRALGLMVLGALHMAFVFGGDILFSYGVMCLIFWMWRDYALRTPLKRFLKVTIILNYALLAFVAVVGFGLFMLFDLEWLADLVIENSALGKGFAEASLYRISGGMMVMLVGILPFLGLEIAALGLGYKAANCGFFDVDSDAFKKLGDYIPTLLVVGLSCNIPYALIGAEVTDSSLVSLGFLLWFIGAPALSAVYLYYIVNIARKVTLPLVLVQAGRNSLSVYVLQGLIASVLFGGYGFGLFDRFGEFDLFFISVGIYGVSVFLVGLYATQFGRGFLEPVLRRISGSSTSRLGEGASDPR